MSRFISEMLEEAEPMLERMSFLFSRVKEQQDANRSRILGGLHDVQKNIEPMLDQMIDQLDFFVSSSGLGDGVESDRPHPTNRGVTDVQPIDNKQTSKKTRGGKKS